MPIPSTGQMPADSDTTRLTLARARVGEVLKGKWRLDELLGVGGMAAVYSATHRNGNRVAIKILHPEAALVSQIRNRFLREGYLANRVGHPGAVSIIDDDVDEEGRAFLVMELLEGETLESLCSDRAEMLRPEDVLVIAHEILDVLAAAHDKDIVHRDLKPANVFIERSGTVRLLDFGIARLLDAQSGPGETAGQTIGTPGFMPPEQARGRSQDVGPQTDVWAVGATMFFLVTGRPVHAEGTVAEQLVAAITDKAPALASIDPTLPAPFCGVVDTALAYERRDRYAHARVMRQAVREAYHEMAGTPPMDSARRLMPRSVPLFHTLQTAPTLSAGATPVDHPALPGASLNSLTPPGTAATTQPSLRRRRERVLVMGASGLAIFGVFAAAVLAAVRPGASGAAEVPLPSALARPAPEPSTSELSPAARASRGVPAPVVIPATESSVNSPSSVASAAPSAFPAAPTGQTHRPARAQPRRSAAPAVPDAGHDEAGAAKRVDLFNRRK